MDLKKHFKQLHQREREKKLNRLKSLKVFVAVFGILHRIDVGIVIDLEPARTEDPALSIAGAVQSQKLAVRARRTQRFLSPVPFSRRSSPCAQFRNDSDFSEMLRRAREAHLGTVVVGDWDRALGRHADLRVLRMVTYGLGYYAN
ncbi:phytochrome B [Vigna unguiculata]|uniref:Phytochrome B n=1 Tax=Vigna unguiculata TaxID=3917 RepID=A0A4D6NJ24_VIGUN|nr:phytochrome B [Vigna unguiculata]